MVVLILLNLAQIFSGIILHWAELRGFMPSSILSARQMAPCLHSSPDVIHSW